MLAGQLRHDGFGANPALPEPFLAALGSREETDAGELFAAHDFLRPFADLADLCRRIDLSKVNRRTLEALIRAGCLDGLGTNRATLMHQLPAALQLGEQSSRASEAGQVDLFGLAAQQLLDTLALAR